MTIMSINSSKSPIKIKCKNLISTCYELNTIDFWTVGYFVSLTEIDNTVVLFLFTVKNYLVCSIVVLKIVQNYCFNTGDSYSHLVSYSQSSLVAFKHDNKLSPTSTK